MTKGRSKAIKRRQLRRAMRNSDAIGRGKMLGTAVRRTWGKGVPDGASR